MEKKLSTYLIFFFFSPSGVVVIFSEKKEIFAFFCFGYTIT